MTTEQQVSAPAVESPEVVEKKSLSHSETTVEVEENKEESPIEESKEETDEEANPVVNGPATETATIEVETEQPPTDLADQEGDSSGDVETKATEEEEEVDGPELVDSSLEEEDSESVEPVEDEPTVEDEGTEAAAPATEKEEKPITPVEEETTGGSGEKATDVVAE